MNRVFLIALGALLMSTGTHAKIFSENEFLAYVTCLNDSICDFQKQGYKTPQAIETAKVKCSTGRRIPFVSHILTQTNSALLKVQYGMKSLEVAANCRYKKQSCSSRAESNLDQQRDVTEKTREKFSKEMPSCYSIGNRGADSSEPADGWFARSFGGGFFENSKKECTHYCKKEDQIAVQIRKHGEADSRETILGFEYLADPEDSKVECITCGDPKYFEDPSYNLRSKKHNACVNKDGCPYGTELRVVVEKKADGSTKNEKKCRSVCSPPMYANSDGECVPDPHNPPCDNFFNKQVEALDDYAKRSGAVHFQIGSCGEETFRKKFDEYIKKSRTSLDEAKARCNDNAKNPTPENLTIWQNGYWKITQQPFSDEMKAWNNGSIKDQCHLTEDMREHLHENPFIRFASEKWSKDEPYQTYCAVRMNSCSLDN